MRLFYLIFIVFSLGVAVSAGAQPTNDNCEGAIALNNVRSYCSAVGEFSNTGGTPSGYDAASCFSGAHNDVWFTFVPNAINITITVIGNKSQGSGGTLNQPEVALYLGTCGGTIFEQECESDRVNNIVELNKGGLAVGQRYYIRVQGRGGLTGSFQLCIDNFNPPAEPGSDCRTAAVLCSKDPFVVQSVSGAGSDPREANDATCFGNLFGQNVESASTWFTWTAANDGPLTFTLTPLNPSDDLDFVVYELPNGPLDCSGKRVVRCMASGSFNFPSNCMGPTGLRESSRDDAEPAGCNNPTQDNFLAALNMQQGRSYALFVNNFTSTRNGFQIEFGGTGEFLGPQAAINTSATTVCVGEEISFTDASTFALGSISKWEWIFGEGASIASSDSRGPHTVTYDTPGEKSIVLTVTSNQGCIVTEIINITVTCCADQFALNVGITDVLCSGDSNGAIDLSVTNNFAPLTFQWTSGQSTEDLSGVPAGDYSVTVTDRSTCDTIVTYSIGSPPPFDIDTLITMPTCNGGTDGAVQLNVSGATPPFQFNWQNTGFSGQNGLTNIPRGDYAVVIRDQNNCEIPLSIPVRELELVLDPRVSAITSPTCTGFADGSIQVVISNGLPPYQYDWNDGLGFRDENSLNGLQADTFLVEVLDANLCRGTFEFFMADPPPLGLALESMPTSCNGDADGTATATVEGGLPDYIITWSDGQKGASATQLKSGRYTVTVEDVNGCQIEGAIDVVEPAPVEGQIVGIIDVICFGESTGQVTVGGSGGTPPYEYSIDDVLFRPDAAFPGLPAGTYTFSVMDSEGCTGTVQAAVNQPPPLIVEAGQDQTVDLGFTVRLRAVANALPVTYQWTPADDLDCPDCPNPEIFPLRTTTFTVLVTDLNNCTALDSVTITVTENRPYYAPNAFSPDGDGFNDFYTIYGGPSAEEILTLRIFDRWGELVFEGLNLPFGDESTGWDGTFRGRKLNAGVYVVLAEIKFIDGKIVLYEGDIHLMR